jgi:hypothetical protein
MPHFVSALAVSFLTMILTWSYLKPIRIPLLTYLIAYTGTTVIGAAGLLDDLGLREFKLHQPMFRPEDYPLVGSAIYWALLLAPFLLVPLGTVLGLRAASPNFVDGLAGFVSKDEQSIIPIVYFIVFACAMYCLWKLISTGAYFPDLLFDRALSCNVRLARRTELFGELRYLYYSFAYAVLPMGATLSLLAWQERGGHFHAAMFFILFIAVLYFNVVLFMKANVVVFFLTLLFANVVARASFRSLIALGLAAAISLLLMQGLLGCYRDSSADALTGLDTLVVPHSVQTASSRNHERFPDAVRASISAPAAESQSAPVQPGSSLDAVDAAARFVRSIIFRTAASLPYYVQIFSNPDERCGIESNSLPFLPRETCYPATKVGTRINPGEIQAFQSAPAHVFAYAELGLGYALLVLLLGGCIMGVGWGVACKARSPLFWSAGAAVCVFAYYLTQAGLVGALTHSYGFVWYLFPILAAVAIYALARTIVSCLSRRMKVGIR